MPHHHERATPLQRRRRRLHLQTARCSARRPPGFTIRQLFPSFPCKHALAALQPQAVTCQAASPTDLQAAAARALFKPRGLAMSRQDCNSTTRPFAWSAELRYRINFTHITAGGPLGMLHLPVPHCSMSTPTTAPPAPLGNLQSLQLHDHTATLVRSVRVI